MTEPISQLAKVRKFLAINAGPGTGKTYTATHLIKYLRAPVKETFLKMTKHTEEQLAIWKWCDENISPTFVTADGRPKEPQILYAAYTKAAVEEITSKVPQRVDLRTVHGAGYKLLLGKYGYLPMNNSRGTQIVSDITGQPFNKLKDSFKWLSTLRFIEKAKEEMLDVNQETCVYLQNKYDSLVNMLIHPDIATQAKEIIPRMKRIDRKMGIEYIDQVWLAVWACTHPVYDLGIIDECQDLSPARLLLVRQMCRNLVFVGDPDQAIMAFSGADAHSFEKISAICDQQLPLKTTFRLPPNIVSKANQHTPRARLKGLDKPVGHEAQFPIHDLSIRIKDSCRFLGEGEINPYMYNDHMIVCRYNAPLIECCLKLWKAHIPATILGRQLVENLISIIKARKAQTIEELEFKLDRYEETTCRSAPEYIQEVVRDKLACIRYVINALRPSPEETSLQGDNGTSMSSSGFPKDPSETIEVPMSATVTDVEESLKKLFAVKKNQPHVSLCTIHKAKGAERKNIYILYPPIPSPRAQSPEQKQQEKNLEFVAITRTLQNLYWVVK